MAKSDLHVHRVNSAESHSGLALKPVAYEAGQPLPCLFSFSSIFAAMAASSIHCSSKEEP